MALRSRSDFITIVSGLPRSGTSMMMRMLDAGGLPVVVDDIRARDIDNPNGYYEFEPVKQVGRDAGWLADIRGSVVKIIYLLLRDLPLDYRYRVVFMRRDLREVVASQEAMMARRGTAAQGGGRPEEVIPLFEAQLRAVDQWLRERENFSVLDVRYDEVVAEPMATAVRVDEFLGGGLDTESMAAAVDPSLYRQRAGSG